MMYENYYAVIMAGGGGTRLWPLSRKSRPKQLLKLSGNLTLFQMAVRRLDGLFPPERILVVTVAEQVASLREQCPEIPNENYLIEPMPRGTASVVGLAAVELIRRTEGATMAVLTADHFIENEALFRDILSYAYIVAKDNFLLTLGLQPTYPATGYGYIQRGDALMDYQKHPVFQMLRFKEKPDEDQAKDFIAGGDHYWNSGMFIWRVERVMEELKKQMPDLFNILIRIQSSWDIDEKEYGLLKELWPTILPETIDYGIMEGASRAAIMPAENLLWNDVGSWDSLFDVLPEDEHGNIVIDANHISLDTGKSLICSDKEKRLIVTIGIDDLVIVDTADALLISSRKDAQKVRNIVKLLREEGKQNYL